MVLFLFFRCSRFPCGAGDKPIPFFVICWVVWPRHFLFFHGVPDNKFIPAAIGFPIQNASASQYCPMPVDELLVIQLVLNGDHVVLAATAAMEYLVLFQFWQDGVGPLRAVFDVLDKLPLNIVGGFCCVAYVLKRRFTHVAFLAVAIVCLWPFNRMPRFS